MFNKSLILPINLGSELGILQCIFLNFVDNMPKFNKDDKYSKAIF